MNFLRNFYKNFRSIPNKFLLAVEDVGGFVIASFEYAVYRLDTALNTIGNFTFKNLHIYRLVKFKVVGTLIWSQGKVGLRIRYWFIILFLLGVFVFGGIFQDVFVEDKEEETFAFLNTDSVLIARASASTEQGQTRLLDGPVEYTVQEGESLLDVGRKYGVTLESLKYANNLVKDTVPAGTTIKVPPVNGVLHQVKQGETIEALAKRYRVPSQTIVDFNYLDFPYELEDGQTITIPKANVPTTQRYYAGTPVYDTSAYGIIPSQKFEGAGKGKFSWPLAGILTQHFSSYHPALDIANRTGDIVASDDGHIVRAGWWEGGYGNAVQIDHGNGFVSTYAHMSSINVSVGQEVSQGDKIGVVGSTGRSTGPHLHFTIQSEGKYMDPLQLLPR